jgi:hypothetical protein
MNCQELLELADNQHVEIALHLPEYEAQLIMVGGAITTEERFKNFTDSLCHLFDDGIIRRYSHEIGSFADIEVLNIIDADCVDTAEQGLRLTGGSLPVLEEFSTPQTLSNLKADSNPTTRK